MSLSRRDFIYLGLTAPAALARGADARPADLHQQLLDRAAKLQEQRRARFAAVKTRADLEALQKDLRQKFLDLLGGLPTASGPPPAKVLGQIDAGDYRIDKLAFESFPGYFVTALLYRPKKLDGKAPGIISPCGHSAVGKASGTYQILHINLVKRGCIVLTYDPVGQGERSQFWDAPRGRSKYNLVCGEHCVLGNPLYLLGVSLARYRIWDGLRAIDYLESLPEVDKARIGCVGNSGGGTLTAYIAALDPRVQAAVTSCYITTLPRRMGNRIQRDPDSDPEQDIAGFVSQGIDHAGLLALRTPRPTLVNSAILDFFPIEGARESFAEAKRLFETAGAGDRISMVEANEKHGLTLPLRQGAYAFFDRWLLGRQDVRETEIAAQPREAKELQVCPAGQVNVSFQSRHLLPLGLEEFRKRKPGQRQPLRDVLRPDPASTHHSVSLAVEKKNGAASAILCINGNEAPAWPQAFAIEVVPAGDVAVIDPRGVGKLRPALEVKGRDYADPLVGPEANIAYNAFLAGTSLLAMRVADVLAAVKERDKVKRLVLVGRRDAALVALLAAALEPKVTHVALEELRTSFLPLFDPAGEAVNAASILPCLLRDYGDIPELLAEVAPRKVLLAAPLGKADRMPASVTLVDKRFTQEPAVLLNWMKG